MNFKIIIKDIVDATHYVLGILNKIWHYPIVNPDNQPIALSNLVIAFVLLLGILKFSKKLSSEFNRRMAHILHMDQKLEDKNLIRSLDRISHYIWFITLSFIALELSNIPITAFAFIGGALAIGLGFGSQNILNNFISGLIIIIEQPIRIGDVIRFDNILGTITNIGARCTHILTYDNHDIIIPNSTLLQDNVVNLTLTNEGLVRGTIELAIDIENDNLQLINDTLTDIVLATNGISKDRDPEVSLCSIEESGLKYKIYFWFEITQSISKDKIINNILIAVHSKFRELGIKFPDKDKYFIMNPEPK